MNSEDRRKLSRKDVHRKYWNGIEHAEVYDVGRVYDKLTSVVQ